MKKWTKNRLLAAMPKIAKDLNIREFEGKTAEAFLAWTKSSDSIMDFPGLDTDAEIITAFKTVTITADAGEDVVVVGEEEVADDLGTESKAEDGEDEDEEDKAAAKAWLADQKVTRAKERKTLRELQGGGIKGIRAAGMSTLPGQKGRIGDRLSHSKKAYDKAVETGAKLASGRTAGKTPIFYNADRCEWFGAWARLDSQGTKWYSQKDSDEHIMATKTGLAGVNTTGGALIFGEQLPELIDNHEEGGVAREMIGVTSMREGQQTVSKLGSDITVTDIGEAETIASSDPIFGNVDLIAGKTGVMAKESSELLNDSAFNVGDIIARSIMRATGIFEDSSVFLGSNNRQGVSDLVGSNSTLDAALSANWSEFTIQDIQDWLALIPSWAMKDPNFGIVCSLPFYMRVLRRFALSAGGTTGDSMLGGINGGFQWDGIKVGISQVMPLTYTGNALVAYAGAWGNSSKFGVVTGSERLDSSDQRFFDEDLIAFRRLQRWTFNGHDINDTTNSGIVALKD